MGANRAWANWASAVREPLHGDDRRRVAVEGSGVKW